MFNTHDVRRDACQLFGRQAKRGYDWWWHSLTARHAQTGRERAFFIEFFLCNPAGGGDAPVFGQLPQNRKNGVRPSYLMVKAGAWGEGAAQLHRFFGWNEAAVDWGVPFSVRAEDCFVTETQIIWHVEQRNRRDRMVTDLVCDKADMLLVNYEAPDGQKRHNRLWNGGSGRGVVELYHNGALVDRVRVENAGCEYGEYDD